MYLLVDREPDGNVSVTALDAAGVQDRPSLTLRWDELPSLVADREADAPRWVWDDTARWYPRLLESGLRVRRCHDLRLCHTILRRSEFTAGSALAMAADGPWDAASRSRPATSDGGALFELVPEEGGEDVELRALPEFRRQLDAVSSSDEAGRLRLLLAAESVGALIAAEMHHAGLPWRRDIHDRLLAETLGPRVPAGVRPRRLEDLADQVRIALADRELNPDSQQDLLRALRRAGVTIASTRAGELKKVTHPVIEPLLEYRKLSRLLGANGWSWMDTWVVDGRFRPDYVPGGVVSGRWATSGGGALQLPRRLRGAVIADEGWRLVVADAAQLEPRILAALSADTAMAAAGRGSDLYSGIVAGGVLRSREQAKSAMLGAMYGATTGEAGRLLPALARAYPRALQLTESAARAGERGDIVSTRLGRSSPRPDEAWQAAQAQAYEPSASGADEARARARGKDWGRFTRNFVVQGTAAEWALCWMAEIRKALWSLGPATPGHAGARGADFAQHPHLVFFLHDEVIVHTPADLSPQVENIVRNAAATAGRLLFGDFPVDFMLTVATVDSYAEAP